MCSIISWKWNLQVRGSLCHQKHLLIGGTLTTRTTIWMPLLPTSIKTVHYTVNHRHCLFFVLLESPTNMRHTYCYVVSVYRSVISWFRQAMLTRTKRVSTLLFQLLNENKAENIVFSSLHVKHHSPVYSPQNTA